jgi:hypothetical protein
MSTIVTRAGKGAPLTNTELDSNFTNLNTDKLEINAALGTPASVTLTNATGLPTAGLVDNAVTNEKLRDSAGLSVIGRGANSTGDPADIVAGTNHQVLRRDGSSLGFGAVDLSSNQAVTGTLPVNQGGTGITSFGAGVATWLGTPTSANLAAAVTDETGTGALVFATSPTLVTPALGTPASGVVTNLTGTASININGTVGATTPAAGAFTTLNTSGAVVFNEAGANVDFRVEGDTNANLLFVDASADNVGIGTSSPTQKLDVNGNISLSGAGTGIRYLALLNETNTYAGNLNLQAGGGSAAFGGGVSMYGHSHATYPGAVWIGYSLGTSTGIIFGSGGNGVNSEAMRLNSTGLGIGTSAPAFPLDVRLANNQFILAREASSNITNGFRIGGPSNESKAVFSANSATGEVNLGAINTNYFLTFSTNGANERMRITSAGDVGIGTSSPDAKLDVTSTGTASAYTVTAVIQDANYPASGNPTLEFNGFIGGNGYRAGIGSIGGQQLAFYTPSTFGVAPTRQMTLNESGNLGIGTSSPAAYLHTAGTVNKQSIFEQTGTGANFFAFKSNGTERAYIGLDSSTGTELFGSGVAYGLGLGTLGAAPISLITNNTIRATLDSSGNLGLGVTPSAWGGFNALQIGSGASLWAGGGGNAYVAGNYYFDGSVRRYINTGNQALELGMINGAFAFNIAPSGTAGDPITFTQAMTLDASGNLGIGTTSPGAKLHLSAASGTVQQQFSNGGTSSYIGHDSGFTGFDIAGGGGVRFRYFNGSVFAEGMRLTSDGYLRMASGSGGIQFNGDTAAANALDDYERGTWTPTTAGDATGAISGAVGEYVKVGRMVYLRGYVSVTTNFTANSLGGLPFTPSGNTTSTSLGAVSIALNNSAATLCCSINIDTGYINFFTDNNTNNTGGLTTTNLVIRFSFVYQATA